MPKGSLFFFGVCLLLCVGSLFGNLYRLQADTPVAATPPPVLVAEPQSNVQKSAPVATSGDPRVNVRAHRQSEVGNQQRYTGSPSGEQDTSLAENEPAPHFSARFLSDPATDIESDFYQTIIRNNLFAPLGTNLHQKPVPGASVKLIATFTRKDPADASAIVLNIASGEQKTVGVGSMFAGYQVRDIQAKQILLEKASEAPHHKDRDRVSSRGERAIWKRMSHPFLLN